MHLSQLLSMDGFLWTYPCGSWFSLVEIGLVLGSITTADVLGGIGGSSDTGGLRNPSYSLQQSTA